MNAIKIIATYLEDCPLLYHLMDSYQKNYYPNLDTIVFVNLKQSQKYQNHLDYQRAD